MREKEFFVSYLPNTLGKKTKQTLKRFSFLSIGIILLSALFFSVFQKPFSSSIFEFEDTKLSGVFYETPYPMLSVKDDNGKQKSILLLGFGKFGANPYLKKIKEAEGKLNGKNISIEGNLIYYNGKTLLQITDEEKITFASDHIDKIPQKIKQGEQTLLGEIIDPKCYFGVMKPGHGKIHRSCAVRCISGGIPPVFASENNDKSYYLITDKEGHPINEKILDFVGKSTEIKGDVYQQGDWFYLQIDMNDIKGTYKNSLIYFD